MSAERTGSVRLPVAGAYWLAEPGVDLDEALREARNLPYHVNDGGVKFGKGVIEVGVLDDRVATVEVSYAVLDAPSIERLRELSRAYDEEVMLPLWTEGGLELRDHLGGVVAISDSATTYDVHVLRRLPRGGETAEQHLVLCWPDDVPSLDDVVTMAYVASYDELDDEVQYDARVLQRDEPHRDAQDAARRAGLAIVRALESRWPNDPDEARTRAHLLASDLTSSGGFEATISESVLGPSVYVDAQPLGAAILAVVEAVLTRPGVDRDSALLAARDAVNALDTSPYVPPTVAVRPGRDGVADRVRNGGTPLLRTDYSDDAAWRALVAAVEAPQEIDGEQYVVAVDAVSDPDLAGLTADALLAEWPDELHGYVMLADADSMTPEDPTVLYVDLRDQPGRVFRCAAGEVASIRDNLDIDNMAFADFADEVGEDGVFRGF